MAFQPAAFDLIDVLAEAFNVLLDMRGENNGRTLFPQTAEKLPKVLRTGGIQTVHRLIEQQKFWVFHQRLCDPKSLAHTERVFADRLPALRV